MADRGAAHKPTLIIVKKRRAHHEGHHGGAWKVAYADFVTAMMAFFMVMWLVNQNQDVKQAVGGYFRDPLGTEDRAGTKASEGSAGVLAAGQGPIEGQPGLLEVPLAKGQDADRARREKKRDLDRLAQEIRQKLASLPEFETIRHLVDVQLTDEGLRIELMESEEGTFFERGSREPSEIGERVLRALATTLGASAHRLVIEGHTDSLAYAGGAYSNWDLSTDRANAARKVLAGGGVTPDQVKEIRGYAAERPRFHERPEDPRNRRISVLLPTAPEPAQPPGTPAG
ncbi:MAG: flagellar motor protein MotB [Proteobacteria bacterium]|nr:MAG: flagellar motor protein MotB [Pseudomonadota bacterium]